MSEALYCKRTVSGKRHVTLGSIWKAWESSEWDTDDHPHAGDWFVSEGEIYVILPRAGMACLPLTTHLPHPAARWGYDGNADAPTLSPSIHSPGKWHGFMRAGTLESC